MWVQRQRLGCCWAGKKGSSASLILQRYRSIFMHKIYKLHIVLQLSGNINALGIKDKELISHRKKKNNKTLITTSRHKWQVLSMNFLRESWFSLVSHLWEFDPSLVWENLTNIRPCNTPISLASFKFSLAVKPSYVQ